MTHASAASLDHIVVEVKNILIEVSNLPQLNVDTLDETTSLFEDGIGLDSIDVLELVVHLDRRFGLKIKNDETGRHTLRNVRCIAEAIYRQKAP